MNAKNNGKDRWTATSIGTLAPRASAYSDPAESNLQLLVRAKKDGSVTRSFLMRFTFERVPALMTLGRLPAMSLSDARAKVRELRELAAQGIDPRRAMARHRIAPAPLAGGAAVSSASARYTVDFLVSEFIERKVKRDHKHPDYVQRMLDRDVLPIWRGRDARTIELTDVHAVLDPIQTRGSPVMAKHTASILKQLFKFGANRGIVKNSPVLLLDKSEIGGKEKPRQRTLSETELRAFFSNRTAATRYPRLSHVIGVLLLTAVRRSELALATWDQIDFKAKTWSIPASHTKTNTEHVVPLSDAAVEEFRALKGLSKRSAFVIPNKAGDAPIEPRLLTRGVGKCLKRFEECGVQPFTLHDLRRTCRTGLSKLKVAPHIAERVLNHAQEKIVGTYDTFQYIDEKRAALQAWAAYLEMLMPVMH